MGNPQGGVGLGMDMGEREKHLRALSMRFVLSRIVFRLGPNARLSMLWRLLVAGIILMRSVRSGCLDAKCWAVVLLYIRFG